MQTEPEKVTELRTLMRKIQINQEGWFDLARSYGALDLNYLNFKNVKIVIHEKEYGTIKIETPLGETDPVVTLIRPKEGELTKSPDLIDKTQLTITQRFSIALIKSHIIRLLRDDGFLDYAGVDYPPSTWQQYQVELNGTTAPDVRWACAVDGLTGCFDRNEKGQFIPSTTKGDLKIVIKSGHVVIFKGEQQPFF